MRVRPALENNSSAPAAPPHRLPSRTQLRRLLAALDAEASTQTLAFADATLRLTQLDRIYWPAEPGLNQQPSPNAT